jgi:hypothetical protein
MNIVLSKPIELEELKRITSALYFKISSSQIIEQSQAQINYNQAIQQIDSNILDIIIGTVEQQKRQF